MILQPRSRSVTRRSAFTLLEVLVVVAIILVLASVATRVDISAHPLLQAREPERNVVIIVVTADRGLCGAFNSNVIRAAQNFIREHSFESVALLTIGRNPGEARPAANRHTGGWSRRGPPSRRRCSRPGRTRWPCGRRPSNGPGCPSA